MAQTPPHIHTHTHARHHITTLGLRDFSPAEMTSGAGVCSGVYTAGHGEFR